MVNVPAPNSGDIMRLFLGAPALIGLATVAFLAGAALGAAQHKIPEPLIETIPLNAPAGPEDVAPPAPVPEPALPSFYAPRVKTMIG
jgi:hypothetical protein